VLVSPIVEACPNDNKEMAMSLLHSFYCWGQVGVVLLSTIFFAVVGIAHWRILSVLWAILPIANLVVFTQVPIAPIIAEGETGLTFKELARSRVFWILMLMMVCAGASEQAVSQWASAFAESGLHVSKSMGDLLGPMLFGILMGTARAIFGKLGDRIRLDRYMVFSCGLCIVSYLMIGLSGNPIIAFAGCAICGFSVGIMWPGTFSMGSAGLKNGGTLMFALFALAGDLGCGGGPTFAGLVSSASGDTLSKGILAAVIFPVLMLIATLVINRGKNNNEEESA